MGFLEFLLGATESADPATPTLDNAVLELIIDKKNCFFFSLLCFSQIKKKLKKKTKTNKPTNPQSEFDSKSKPWNFREREQKGIG